ncbi:MAG: DUF1566 domain-containing protein [Candidatus Sumerlaeota bacterium]|nr:DUF1566 domain-containing protein [Candidatus Sumerlaeota bacterium]
MNKTYSAPIKYLVPGLFILIALGGISLVVAGTLDNPNPPGTSDLFSLEEIYQFIYNVDKQIRQGATSHTFLPENGPSPTMHTTTDIYNLLQRLPATGCESSYIAGDDGNLRRGATKRYRNELDGTILDQNTGLLWVQNGDMIGTLYPNFDQDGVSLDGNVSWPHALAFVEKMNDGTVVNYGYKDWRLPNVMELISLVDYGRYKPAANPVFTSIGDEYWTSTSHPNYAESSYSYTVVMKEGLINKRAKTNYYAKVIAVRNITPIGETNY